MPAADFKQGLGTLKVDLTGRTVEIAGRSIRLSDKEYAVLALLLKRWTEPEMPTLRSGRLRVDTCERVATVDDRRVVLTGKEFQVLELLMLHKGQFVTRDMMLLHLYGNGRTPHPKIIDVLVCKLRRKLAAVAGTRPNIRTRRGVGYRLEDEEPEGDSIPGLAA